jgi:tRNA A37 threonylcarbamoyladenosine synthetase subunit TsaC/SUA5/YrdC
MPLQVGIIPTDTLPAIVADLENADAVQRLYRVKDAPAKKPLSILCRSFSEISHYTNGCVNLSILHHEVWIPARKEELA